MVKIHYATISEMGKRKNNEDAFLMISMSDNNMSKEKNNLNVNVFFVRMPFPQKSTQEMLLMAMLDIAVGAIECKQRSEHRSFLRKIKYILK